MRFRDYLVLQDILVHLEKMVNQALWALQGRRGLQGREEKEDILVREGQMVNLAPQDYAELLVLKETTDLQSV